MNSKGILFSVMVLVLILAILGLGTVLNNAVTSSTSTKESIQLISISNKYNNIDSQLSLYKKGYPKMVFERILPIKYDINNDTKSILIKQSFPTNNSFFDETMNFLNLFRIFIEDKNYDRSFDGLEVDLNTPRNNFWNGSQNNLSFLINPFCYKIVSDINSISLLKNNTTKCDYLFSSDYIKSYNFIVKIKGTYDYNNVLCDGSPCPQEAPNGTDKYYSLTIDDSECYGCNFTQKAVSKNFSPLESFEVEILENGAQNPITLTSSALDFVFQSNGVSVDLNFEVFFSEKVTDFFISDTNLLVKGNIEGFYKEN